ncbi:MAG TPA: hypothetical protein VFW98_08255 [Gemmatimonadaceae bacterium]|nr:hypothetical protein [Gemmatimonadaceae bacterium]
MGRQATDTTFGDRIYLAHNAIERSVGRRISNATLGAMIAAAEEPPRLTPEGRPHPYFGGHIARWRKEERAMSLTTLAALARLAGMRPCWLAFGDGAPSAEGLSPTAPHVLADLTRTRSRRAATTRLPTPTYQPVAQPKRASRHDTTEPATNRREASRSKRR